MPYLARAEHTGTGSLDDFGFTFSYIEQADVVVILDGVIQTLTTDYTFLDASTISFVSTPASGAAIVIKRVTDITAALTNFNDGGGLPETDLDTMVEQLLFALQELTDATAPTQTYIDCDITTAQADLATSATTEQLAQVQVAEAGDYDVKTHFNYALLGAAGSIGWLECRFHYGPLGTDADPFVEGRMYAGSPNTSDVNKWVNHATFAEKVTVDADDYITAVVTGHSGSDGSPDGIRIYGGSVFHRRELVATRERVN